MRHRRPTDPFNYWLVRILLVLTIVNALIWITVLLVRA